MEVDSLPAFDDLAGAPVEGQTDPTFTRKSSDYESRCERFLRPEDRDYTQQFASMYFFRLETLRPVLMQQVEKKGWIQGEVKLADQLLRAPEDATSVVIVTLFKDMKLKPSILRDYKAGVGVVVEEHLDNYCGEGDVIILEDTSGRMQLVPSEILRVDDVTTGIICALKGVSSKGKFIVEEVVWPGLAPQPALPLGQPDDQYIALMSGLQIGAENMDTLALQMMIDYVTGHLGSSQEIAHAASIVRVVIAGNSLATVKAPAAESHRAKAGSAQDIAAAARALDQALLQLASSVPVDLMPGTMDPAQLMMPQQPISRCIVPESSSLKSLTAKTNPYEAVVAGVSVFGTSGQNVDDLWRYTKREEPNRLDLLANTLTWRHCAPTLPETIACYPYKTSDPFILDASPHIYFAGNQPEFADRLVTDEKEGIATRVIQVPSFAETKSIVLVNLRTLECEPISFDL